MRFFRSQICSDKLIHHWSTVLSSSRREIRFVQGPCASSAEAMSISGVQSNPKAGMAAPAQHTLVPRPTAPEAFLNSPQEPPGCPLQLRHQFVSRLGLAEAGSAAWSPCSDLQQSASAHNYTSSGVEMVRQAEELPELSPATTTSLEIQNHADLSSARGDAWDPLAAACSRSPDSDELHLPSVIPSLLSADEPSDSTDETGEPSTLMQKTPSLALRDTENNAPDSPPSSLPSSPSSTPSSTPPQSPPASPPKGGHRQKLFPSHMTVSSGAQGRRKLQLRAPLAVHMQTSARRAWSATKSKIPPYLAAQNSSYSVPFPRAVPTIPEDVSILCDSRLSDATYDDLDCVSGSSGSFVVTEFANTNIGAGTQTRQGGNLVYVPPDRDEMLVQVNSSDSRRSACGCECLGTFIASVRHVLYTAFNREGDEVPYGSN